MDNESIKDMEDKYQNKKILESISDKIFWAAYADLNNDSLTPTSKGGTCQNFFDILSGVRTYSGFLEFYANQLVSESYRKHFLEILDPANVLSCIKDGSICTVNYGMTTTHGDTRRMTITVFSAGGEFGDGRCMITASSIDDDYNILTGLENYENREGVIESKAKAQMTIVKSLDAIFHSICLINLSENRFQEIISGEGVHPVVQDMTDPQKALSVCTEVFVTEPDQDKIRKFFDLTTLSERLSEQKSISEEFYSTSRKWVRTSFIPVIHEKKDSKGEVLLIVQLIDEEKRAELRSRTALKNAIENLYESREKLAIALSRKSEQLDDAQIHDLVSGLLSLREFISVSDEYVGTLDDENAQEHILIYGNIKKFRQYNSKYGAVGGDKLLRRIAGIIQQFPDILYSTRIEADHFGMLAEFKDVSGQLTQCIDKINKYLLEKDLVFEAGFYRMRSASENVYHALELARAACRSGMQEGELCREYDQNLERKLMVAYYVQNNINEAVSNHWIKVYLQPVVSTLTGDICGYEALARWIDPVEGFLPPEDFISALEDSGDIYRLDQYVIREVCRWIRDCRESGRNIEPISVNLSRLDFIKCDIVDYIENITAEFGVLRSMLNIEVTETTMMHDQKMLQENINRFRSLGYEVWMDDFGSGYSSLNVLKNFSFDEIKLDRGFMIDFDEISKNIIETIVSMAKRMNIMTLAEGVETREQYEYLRKVGVDKVQGFYFSKPKPIEEV